MTATLEQIHEDPEIIDRAISRSERIDVISDGIVAATFTPTKPPTQQHSVLDIPTRDLGPMLKPLSDDDDLLGEMTMRRWVGSLGQAAKSDEHSMDTIRASVAKKCEAL